MFFYNLIENRILANYEKRTSKRDIYYLADVNILV